MTIVQQEFHVPFGSAFIQLLWRVWLCTLGALFANLGFMGTLWPLLNDYGKGWVYVVNLLGLLSLIGPPMVILLPVALMASAFTSRKPIRAATITSLLLIGFVVILSFAIPIEKQPLVSFLILIPYLLGLIMGTFIYALSHEKYAVVVVPEPVPVAFLNEATFREGWPKVLGWLSAAKLSPADELLTPEGWKAITYDTVVVFIPRAINRPTWLMLYGEQIYPFSGNGNHRGEVLEAQRVITAPNFVAPPAEIEG